MIIISNRGNLDGPSEWENEPSYIKEAISEGFQVMVDVWAHEDSLWLGTNEPTYKIEDIEFPIYNANYWCNAKNIEAVVLMKKLNVVEYFYLGNNVVSVTANNNIVTTHGLILPKSVLVHPKLEIMRDEYKVLHGISTDYPKKLK